jgi:hypothetical protein
MAPSIMKTWIILLAAALGIALHGTALAASYQDLVVMVDAKFRDRTEYGAGVIVNETAQQTIIVTALHNVQRDKEPASDIRVELRSLRGKTFTATANRSYKNPALDLAVLFVEHIDASQPPRQLDADNSKAISASKAKSLTGANVQVIGAMGRERWATGVKTDRIVSSTDRLMLIASADGRAGASGGGVFDSLGRLLGVVSRVDPGTGNLEVIPMSVVLEQLGRWGVGVGLASAEAGTSAPELLVQLRKELKLTVSYLPPPKSDPDYPIGKQGLFPHRISAQMSGGLRELKPEIELSYAVIQPNKKQLKLAPPQYAADATEYPAKVEGEAWVVIGDGRRLGPLPFSLDFESGPVAAAATAGKKGATLMAYARDSLAVERKNASVGEENRKQGMAQAERVNAEARHRSDEQFRKTLLHFFDNWSMNCSVKMEKWKCDYPPFADDRLERVLHSMKLGTSKTDMFVDIPMLPVDEFRPLVAAEAERLLKSADDIDYLYVQIQLNSGEKLGPKPLCKVKRYPREGHAYCTNY